MLEQHAGDRLNWAGNYEYRARTIEHPTSLADLQRIVAGATRVRALGSRHSFNDIADSPGTLVCLDVLDPGVRITSMMRSAMASVGAGAGSVSPGAESAAGP